MGIKKKEQLSDIDIYERLYGKVNLEKRLVITPLLFRNKQISNGAIDLRLGTEFILTKKTHFSELDQDLKEELEYNIRNYQRFITIRFNDKIVLHPGQFVLGSTLEYVRIPDDIVGYIIGRSSWGRLGLIIATATLIHPQFAGVITLEITNVGEVPIVLRPGRRIAQISFRRCYIYNSKEVQIPGKYFGSTHPSFSELYKSMPFTPGIRISVIITSKSVSISSRASSPLVVVVISKLPSVSSTSFMRSAR